MLEKKQEFITIAVFEYAADVQVLKAKLESEGIPVFLRDENTLNADPLISYAIGGVKLQVYSKDEHRALAIYDSIRAYAVDNDGKPVICPNCKAARSEVYHTRKGILLKLFPFLEKRRYRCLNCEMITTQ